MDEAFTNSYVSRVRRKIARSKFDVRWLFPLVIIVIAGLLAFSAEIKERVAGRTRAVTQATVIGHSL